MRFVSLLAIGLISSLMAFGGQKIVYESSVSGKTTKTEWDMQEAEDKILLDGHNVKSDIKIECSSVYALLSYFEKSDPNKELDIKKEGPNLIIKSKEGGKEKMKSYKIGKTPWVQDFKFGLQSFLASMDKEFSFYIVNPKDLDVHEMIATKEFEEEIEILGKFYRTQKMKVTLKGFRKKFWKAQVWFDKEKQLLVKYRANEGPGTPYTETILVQGK